MEKYATRNTMIRDEQEFVVNNFELLDSAQVVYFQALDKSQWFGGPNHKVFWNIVRNVTQHIEG